MTFEIHITIEPVFGEQLELAKDLAHLFRFKVADLLMVKRPEDTPERSRFDTFMTGHSEDYDSAEGMCRNCCRALKANGMKIWRYKIEAIMIDSRYQDDPLGAL